MRFQCFLFLYVIVTSHLSRENVNGHVLCQVNLALNIQYPEFYLLKGPFNHLIRDPNPSSFDNLLVATVLKNIFWDCLGLSVNDVTALEGSKVDF